MFLFASAALEAHAGIPGLAKHVDGRETASFAEWAAFGPRVLHFAGALPPWRDKELHDKLIERGGIACDSVRIVEEREAIDVGNVTVYLSVVQGLVMMPLIVGELLGPTKSVHQFAAATRSLPHS